MKTEQKKTLAVESTILSKLEDGNLAHHDMEELLHDASKDCDLLSIANFEGKSLLHLACCLMTLDTARLLIEDYYFDPSVQDNDGNTPLHDASRCQKTQITKYLTSLPNCNLNVQNTEGDTPLHIAVMSSHWLIVRVLLASPRLVVLIENNAKETPLSLLEMQISTNETKKLKKEIFQHSSMKQHLPKIKARGIM